MKREWFEDLPEQCPPKDAKDCEGYSYRIANGNPAQSGDILTMERVLDFYDQPQLFVARDSFNTIYLCLLFDDEPTAQYTAIRICDSRLKSFTNGTLDLRSIYEQPEVSGEYFDVSFSENAYHIEPASFRKITEDRLPAQGYTVTRQPMGNVTLSVPSSDTNLLFDIAKKFGWACVF